MYQSGNVMHALTEKFIDNIYSCVQTYMLTAGFFVTGQEWKQCICLSKVKKQNHVYIIKSCEAIKK